MRMKSSQNFKLIFLVVVGMTIGAVLSSDKVQANLDPSARSPLEYHVVTGMIDCRSDCDSRDMATHDEKIKEIVNDINQEHRGFARIEKVNITPSAYYSDSGNNFTDTLIYTVIYSLPKQ